MLKNRYIKSILTAASSILPMIVIVVLLSIIKVDTVNGWIAIVPLNNWDYVALTIGSLVMIVGLGLFQVGASTGLAKVGEYMGSSLSKQAHLFVVIIFAFLLGALITCAEPSILIVASQVNIDTFLLIAVIAIGVGIFVVVGVVRIIFHGSLKIWYLFCYFIVFSLLCLISVDDHMRNFLPFIFDAGGITTGSATVPFILALGAGVATVRGGRKATSDSFGLVGMASIGPILSMTILLLANKSGFQPYEVTPFTGFTGFADIGTHILNSLIPSGVSHLGTIIEVVMALAPIVGIFLIYNFIFMKLPINKIKELMLGFLFSFLGLVIFLSGVSAIMSPFGTLVGNAIGTNISNDLIVILICFVIGLVTILCEPAVHVLTAQMVSISDGNIKKSTVVVSLSIGVGIAIGLATIRTIFNFSIMYIVIPGYLLSIILMFVTPDIYTAMAFDAGGTASGPMSVSFVLPMIIGITQTKRHLPPASIEYYTSAFGVVALIALTPIITIQLLGIVHNLGTIKRLRIASGIIEDPADAQIIHF